MDEEVKHIKEEKKNTSNMKYMTAIAVVVVVLVIAGLAYKTAKKSTPQTTVSTKPTTAPATSASPTVHYKDGTYSAEGDYQVHIGPERIKVTVTLKNNIITDSTVVAEATDRVSIRLQGVFIDNYKQYVIGKDISALHLGKVSTSSLTPEGFNDALKKIETQAKA